VSLLEASAFLGAALTAAREGIQIDPVIVPLRLAYEHLQKSASALPGFEIVAFAQGCCAAAQSTSRINV
jgi:hypothetical protein